jgi:hypothetical protein
VAISPPKGGAALFLGIFFQISQFDLIPTDDIYPKMVEYQDITDSPHN